MQFHQHRKLEQRMHKVHHQSTILVGILRTVRHSALGRHLSQGDNPIQGHGSQVLRVPLVLYNRSRFSGL